MFTETSKSPTQYASPMRIELETVARSGNGFGVSAEVYPYRPISSDTGRVVVPAPPEALLIATEPLYSAAGSDEADPASIATVSVALDPSAGSVTDTGPADPLTVIHGSSAVIVMSTGVGRVLRNKLGKGVLIVGVEPSGSAVLSGKSPGMHGIQGIGAGFVPEILERPLIDRVVEVSDVAAERMVRRLAREEGFLAGPSSGANVHVAVEVAAELGRGNVVTLLCDSGERYLF